MKHIHIYSVAITLTVVALVLVIVRWDLFFQYIGNTTGVLLGFVLYTWWQEEEKKRSQKEKVELFWKEFKAFLPVLEVKVRLQKETSAHHVFENIFEYRLPLPEVVHFCKQANELGLDSEFRRKLSEIVSHTTVLEEYVDLGADKIMKWHTNFQSWQGFLYQLVLDVKKQYA